MKDIESIKKLAAEIAADLFTSGIGGKVERLALTNDVGDLVRDHGGWCEDAVRDRITVKLTMYAPAPAPEAEPFNAAVAVETIARIKAERDEAREALAAERKVLQALRSTMQASVAGCCGDGAGERFCESYGCGTLKRYIETIDAALAAAPGVPTSGGEGGQS